MGIDKKQLYTICGIIAVIYIFMAYANGKLIDYIFTVPGLLLAITVHEYGHALFAYMLGDTTAKDQGRLSLNPMAHLDPLGMITLLLFRFGWGKPVTFNPNNFNKKVTIEKGSAIVALARPLFNFVCSFVLIVVFFLINKFAGPFCYSTIGQILLNIIKYAIFLNIGLGVFNLIPIPPLDGSKIIRPILPQNIKNFLDQNEMMLYFVLLALVFTGVASYIMSPVSNAIFNFLYSLANLIIH